MLRKFQVSDYVDICKICNEALGYKCDKSLVKRRLEHLDKEREMVFVAEVGAKVVGFIHVEKYKVLYLESMINILGLAVANNYQKKGIGRKLMEAAEQWAKENDIYTMRLNSGLSRKEAHQFYQAHGFDEKKEQLRLVKYL